MDRSKDKQQYELFLKHCRSKKIMVCANNGPDLKIKNGWWNGKWNAEAEIHIYRSNSNNSGFVGSNTSDTELTDFICKSDDIKWELAILLHEYGHWKLRHPHRAISDETVFKEEAQAYNAGEKLAKSLFNGDWDDQTFQALKQTGLSSYNQQLTGLSSNFSDTDSAGAGTYCSDLCRRTGYESALKGIKETTREIVWSKFMG